MLGTTPDFRLTSLLVTAAIFSILFVILLQKSSSPLLCNNMSVLSLASQRKI